MPEHSEYRPRPIQTEGVSLPGSLERLVETLAQNNHDHWALQRMREGWVWGEKRDDDRKLHPGLVAYDRLSESEKEYDRIMARETLKAILATGFQILSPRPAPKGQQVAPEAGTPLQTHLFGPHPKRILALDGGGIKGVMALEFLERLEAGLARRLVKSGKLGSEQDFRLCQYFDLIGGTSTGAIIAAALAMGKRASELKELYLKLAHDVFKVDMGLYGLLFQGAKRFDERSLGRHLQALFQDVLLGGEELQTGLCVVAKRADTGSTWPLHNHPRGKYFEFNGPLKLWRVIRASTAAPTFFRPQYLPLGDRDETGNSIRGAFVDGGVSMANNPALQCLLLALLEGYQFRWSPGEENLLLVSVGNGSARTEKEAREVMRYGLLRWVREVPQMLMDDAFWQNQLLLQAMSRTPTPWEIDGEIGDAKEGLINGFPLAHYLRYDVFLEEQSLMELGVEKRVAKQAHKLRLMSKPRNVKLLSRIGELAAAQQIPGDPDRFAVHIPERFDTVIR